MASENFHIDDAAGLKSQAGELAQINQNIFRVQEQLSDCCAQISQAWQSDTEDRNSYLGNLEKNLQKISTFCAAIKSLSNKLAGFAENALSEEKKGYGG